MCTAITYQTRDHYFGRTLDYEHTFGEEVVITPRKYRFQSADSSPFTARYAIIGMAHVEGKYPLYYDAVNEKGLAMAGLNFVGNAQYFSPKPGKENVPSFALIPWILGHCVCLQEAKGRLENLNITDRPFAEAYPLAQLHWLLADASGCLVIESTAEGLHVYEDPVGVLTNNPPFPQQLFRLRDYMGLSPEDPRNTFAPELELLTYSRGMGALGLPGDLSSQSRFVRAAFGRCNSKSGDAEEESVSQFFHILGTVAQTRGLCRVEDGYEITQYTSCCNTSRGIYYYTTYENSRITAVDIRREDLDGKKLICYPLQRKTDIDLQNL
jgi:choloylglycine hydrolase